MGIQGIIIKGIFLRGKLSCTFSTPRNQQLQRINYNFPRNQLKLFSIRFALIRSWHRENIPLKYTYFSLDNNILPPKHVWPSVYKTTYRPLPWCIYNLAIHNYTYVIWCFFYWVPIVKTYHWETINHITRSAAFLHKISLKTLIVHSDTKMFCVMKHDELYNIIYTLGITCRQYVGVIRPDLVVKASFSRKVQTVIIIIRNITTASLFLSM